MAANTMLLWATGTLLVLAVSSAPASPSPSASAPATTDASAAAELKDQVHQSLLQCENVLTEIYLEEMQSAADGDPCADTPTNVTNKDTPILRLIHRTAWCWNTLKCYRQHFPNLPVWELVDQAAADAKEDGVDFVQELAIMADALAEPASDGDDDVADPETQDGDLSVGFDDDDDAEDDDEIDDVVDDDINVDSVGGENDV